MVVDARGRERTRGQQRASRRWRPSNPLRRIKERIRDIKQWPGSIRHPLDSDDHRIEYRVSNTKMQLQVTVQKTTRINRDEKLNR